MTTDLDMETPIKIDEQNKWIENLHNMQKCGVGLQIRMFPRTHRTRRIITADATNVTLEHIPHQKMISFRPATYQQITKKRPEMLKIIRKMTNYVKFFSLKIFTYILLTICYPYPDLLMLQSKAPQNVSEFDLRNPFSCDTSCGCLWPYILSITNQSGIGNKL